MAVQLNNKIRNYNYKMVYKENETLRARISELQEKLDKTNDKLTDSQEQLTAAQAELEKLKPSTAENGLQGEHENGEQTADEIVSGLQADQPLTQEQLNAVQEIVAERDGLKPKAKALELVSDSFRFHNHIRKLVYPIEVKCNQDELVNAEKGVSAVKGGFRFAAPAWKNDCSLDKCADLEIKSVSIAKEPEPTQVRSGKKAKALSAGNDSNVAKEPTYTIKFELEERAIVFKRNTIVTVNELVFEGVKLTPVEDSTTDVKPHDPADANLPPNYWTCGNITRVEAIQLPAPTVEPPRAGDTTTKEEKPELLINNTFPSHLKWIHLDEPAGGNCCTGCCCNYAQVFVTDIHGAEEGEEEEGEGTKGETNGPAPTAFIKNLDGENPSLGELAEGNKLHLRITCIKPTDDDGDIVQNPPTPNSSTEVVAGLQRGCCCGQEETEESGYIYLVLDHDNDEDHGGNVVTFNLLPEPVEELGEPECTCCACCQCQKKSNGSGGQGPKVEECK